MATKSNVPESPLAEVVTMPRGAELNDAAEGLTPEQERATHAYKASAYILSADLREPLQEQIDAREFVELKRHGRYKFEHADPFHFKGIISYRSGYTQVAGHSTKTRHGFVTLATAVVEDLNVLDVVTADRVVGQISTQHPLFPDGDVPAVTFLGTRFDNLRIGGHPVKVKRSLDILGPWGKRDTSYFKDGTITKNISVQYGGLRNEFDVLRNGTEKHPLSERDARELAAWVNREYPEDREPVGPTDTGGSTMTCSLVKNVSFEDETCFIPFGHVIHVPHFGKVILAELKVNLEKAPVAKNPEDQEHDKYSFALTMIRLEMGCLANGSANIVAMDSNGGGSGGGHH